MTTSRWITWRELVAAWMKQIRNAYKNSIQKTLREENTWKT
jgi:hypothetical protein